MKKDLSYLTDHYDEKIEKVKKINAPLNFIFYTDPHNGLTYKDWVDHPEYGPHAYESAIDTIESMQYIIDRLPNLKCLVCGGDIGNDYAPTGEEAHKSIEEAMEALYKLTIPVHCCIGNHDDCLMVCRHFPERGPMSDFILYPDDLHRLCMKNNPTKENYYYTDFDDLGYRFIFLNTSDFYYGIDENGEMIHPLSVGVSKKQVAWFKEAVKTDKKVLVFSHAPITTKGHYPDCTKLHEDMINGDWMWLEMQKANNVLASIAGHLHFDNIVYDGKITAIDSNCGTALYKGKWDPASPEREYGTITETAFDIISVTDEVIYCTRFGVGQDRVARIIRNFEQA